jgi:hypothetical protein
MDNSGIYYAGRYGNSNDGFHGVTVGNLLIKGPI